MSEERTYIGYRYKFKDGGKMANSTGILEGVLKRNNCQKSTPYVICLKPDGSGHHVIFCVANDGGCGRSYKFTITETGRVSRA